MNILPKKRWHVRTKDNIARVRRDEAAAKEEEQKRQEKLLLAESEARINFLRKKSGVPIHYNNLEESPKDDKTSAPSENIYSKKHDRHVDNQQHVDLFSDYKSHIKKTNKALEDEKKEEQEKYEKQIGYLTYLGQDTNEALKLRSWYEVAPQRSEVGENHTLEKDLGNKQAQDPLTLINALLPRPIEEKKDVLDLKRSRDDYISTPDTPPRKIIKYASINEKNVYSKEKKAKKHKKHKHKHKKEKVKTRKHKYEDYDSDSDFDEIQRIKREKLEKLRKERLIREANERARQDELLAPKKPVQEIDNTSNTPHQRIVQKYNSQFNPEIAKQNMI